MQLFPPRNIPVYRKNQSTLWSPCLLGTPCAVCRRHTNCYPARRCYRCQRGKPPVCERAVPAEPAFGITFPHALALIYAGLAVFVLDRNAIQLTFWRVENVRDSSAKADEEFVFAFLEGHMDIADALEQGWHLPPQVIAALAPERPLFPFV